MIFIFNLLSQIKSGAAFNKIRKGVFLSFEVVYLNLIRIKQWLKNGVVFLPIFFNGSIFVQEKLILSIISFFCFCFASSAIYCINDVQDIDEDRVHPIKCKRPVAAGDIKISRAISVSFCLMGMSIALSAFLLPLPCMWVIIAYLLLNIAYVFRLKKIAIIDMFVIAIGFVLRLYIDSFACQIPLSPWIVSMTFILMLFLAVAKRYDDVRLREEGINVNRKSITFYNLHFLNQVLSILAGVAIVCYLMYTISDDVTERLADKNLYMTTIFVLFGILRYLQITLVNKSSGDPVMVIFKDKLIGLSVLGWLLWITIVLYL